MSLLEYILLFVMSYLAGSLPSAYLILRITQHKDIRTEGSGNIGAMNALRVSKNKWIGLLVLLMDLIKGIVPALVFSRMFSEDHLFLLLLVCGLLLGHSFPVWLAFKGGRGLAVVAGALLVLKPLIVVFWIVLWVVFYLLIRRHIVASMIATFMLPLLIYFLPFNYFSRDVLLMILPACLIIIERHLNRLPDLVREKRLSIQKEGDSNGT